MRARAQAPSATRERLIEAAARLFAERGYRGATLREIASRAGANLAAANYHFGSKQRLYLEVARAEFDRLERLLEERGASAEAADLARLSQAQLVERLRERVRTTLEALLDRQTAHGTLMQRELADPSEALPHIVRRHIDPMRRALERILGRLAPELDEERIERCTRSVVGQVSFYLTHRSALLLLMRRRGYPAGFLDEVADHVTEFSLGGLERLAGQRARPKESAG